MHTKSCALKLNWNARSIDSLDITRCDLCFAFDIIRCNFFFGVFPAGTAVVLPFLELITRDSFLSLKEVRIDLTLASTGQGHGIWRPVVLLSRDHCCIKVETFVGLSTKEVKHFLSPCFLRKRT